MIYLVLTSELENEFSYSGSLTGLLLINLSKYFSFEKCYIDFIFYRFILDLLSLSKMFPSMPSSFKSIWTLFSEHLDTVLVLNFFWWYSHPVCFSLLYLFLPKCLFDYMYLVLVFGERKLYNGRLFMGKFLSFTLPCDLVGNNYKAS